MTKIFKKLVKKVVKISIKLPVFSDGLFERSLGGGGGGGVVAGVNSAGVFNLSSALHTISISLQNSLS